MTGRGYVFAAVMVSVLLHVAAIEWWRHRPTQVLEIPGVQEVTVSLISLEPPVPEPVAEIPPPPLPEPALLRDDEMAEKHKIVRKKPPETKLQPRPQLVQEQQLPAPAPVAEPKPAPAPVAARYDADYLNNPAPSYPQLSRRLGEEGQVLVRVQVSADGKVLSVELKQSSGFERLDEAALKAVAKYRFTAIGHISSVVVPIKFNLKK
ncbi:MAG TPA: TonB family protein [Pseudomonadales bacterium]|nr:TonB family protein [Pseudomonadales bacterium]